MTGTHQKATQISTEPNRIKESAMHQNYCINCDGPIARTDVLCPDCAQEHGGETAHP